MSIDILRADTNGFSEERINAVIALGRDGKAFAIQQKDGLYWVGKKIGCEKVSNEDLKIIGGKDNFKLCEILNNKQKKNLIKDAKDTIKRNRRSALRNH